MKIILVLLAFSSVALAEAPKQEVLSKVVSSSYTVPVKDELTEYAKFEIRDLKVTLDKADLKLAYQLPKELVGANPQTLAFAGTIPNCTDPIELKGKNVTSKCTREGIKITCDVKSQNLKGSGSKARRFVEKKYKGEEAAKRTLVAAAFSTEPIGKITYDLPTEMQVCP